MAVGVALALVGTSTPAEAHQDTSQQQCINELNKNLGKVAKTQGKEICACIKDGSKGTLSGTIEACTTADSRGKVARAKSKTKSKGASKCTRAPDFGATDPNTLNAAAIKLELDLFHDYFGPDLDLAILKFDQAKAGAQCQQAVAKQGKKCADALIKEFNACKKGGLSGRSGTPPLDAEELQAACLGQPEELAGIPDPRGKVEKACVTKLNSTIQKKCEDVDLGIAFPGPGLQTGGSRTLHVGVADVTAADVQAALIAADALDACGNGLIEAGEACDDGGIAPADGCSASCQVEEAEGFVCQGEPSVCELECSNGTVDGLEQCDDGNVVPCDGCSPSCRLEFCGDNVLCADTDGDGVPDVTDNCPFVPNPGQENNGGLGGGPDEIGDACQCGDVDGDGDVTSTDGTLIKLCEQELSPCDPNGPGLTRPGNCDVNGDGGCNGTDGTITKRNVMGLTPCAPGVGQMGEVCDGQTLTEDQRCANAQPGAGGGGATLIEECDDGNTADGDGCSSQCVIEFCGDGILQSALSEDCEPPGSICTDGSGCQPDCNCAGAIGRIETDLVARARCLGVDPNGTPYDPDDPNNRCLDFVNHGDCNPVPSQGRCIVNSNAFLNTVFLTPLVTIPLIGDPNTPELSFAFDCGPIDPVTDMATCTCELLELLPVQIAAIGFVCFAPFPGCPAGTLDCRGGSNQNVTVTSNHDVGPTVLALDPDILAPTCSGQLVFTDPNHFASTNDECALMCDIYCDSLEPQGTYIPILTACEGYCQAGERKDLACNLDAECPDGSCAGGDPVFHKGKCGCDCLQVGGDQIARPGAMNCQAGVRITVEQAEPCDSVDINIDLPDKCIPLSTEESLGEILNANSNLGTKIPKGAADRVFTGTPANCEDLSNGIVTGIKMSGTANFFDSNLGDLQVEVNVEME